MAECSVCMEKYSHNRFPMIAGCGHSFCEKCVKIGNNCPKCRNQIVMMLKNFSLMEIIENEEEKPEYDKILDKILIIQSEKRDLENEVKIITQKYEKDNENLRNETENIKKKYNILNEKYEETSKKFTLLEIEYKKLQKAYEENDNLCSSYTREIKRQSEELLILKDNEGKTVKLEKLLEDHKKDVKKLCDEIIDSKIKKEEEFGISKIEKYSEYVNDYIEKQKEKAFVLFLEYSQKYKEYNLANLIKHSDNYKRWLLEIKNGIINTVNVNFSECIKLLLFLQENIFQHHIIRHDPYPIPIKNFHDRETIERMYEKCEFGGHNSGGLCLSQ